MTVLRLRISETVVAGKNGGIPIAENLLVFLDYSTSCAMSKKLCNFSFNRLYCGQLTQLFFKIQLLLFMFFYPLVSYL